MDEDALRDLMVRYQAGDARAMEEVVTRLSPRLFTFLSDPRLGRSDVEDLLQDCWLRIHNARHTYRATEPLLPWIFAVARHTRQDDYRRRQRRARREVVFGSVPEPAAHSSGAARRPDVMGLVDELPAAQREVVLLLKVSGMSLDEVARATGSSLGAIKQKAHRAYATLRKLLEREGV